MQTLMLQVASNWMENENAAQNIECNSVMLKRLTKNQFDMYR